LVEQDTRTRKKAKEGKKSEAMQENKLCREKKSRGAGRLRSRISNTKQKTESEERKILLRRKERKTRESGEKRRGGEGETPGNPTIFRAKWGWGYQEEEKKRGLEGSSKQREQGAQLPSEGLQAVKHKRELAVGPRKALKIQNQRGKGRAPNSLSNRTKGETSL